MLENVTRSDDDPLEILLVEDNPGDVRLIEEAFESSERGTVLQAFRDGDEAVERLYETAERHSEKLPDLALVDLNLPGRDGCEVLEAIRNHEKLTLLPVIILTGSAAQEDIERCYGANANAYLRKPSGPGELESLVTDVTEFWAERAVLPPIPA